MQAPTLDDLARTQPVAVAALREALGQDRMHHATIVSGPSGTPVSALCAAVGRVLVCAKPLPGLTACGACLGCRKVDSGSHPDVFVLAPNDKHVIAIDAVRAVISRLALKAREARVKILHIERAHTLNLAAQNALLKTLEEPPGDCVILLASARRGALLATLRSRCQHVHLAPPDPATTAALLAEAGIEPELLPLLNVLVGGNVATALDWQEAGAGEVWRTLQHAVQPRATTLDVFKVTADLAADKPRFEMALAFVELLVRDALAHRHGADVPALLLGPRGQDAPLEATGAAIMALRRMQQLNLNRTLALESVLLALH